MTEMPKRAGGGYLRFLAWVAAVSVLILLLGYVPTRHLGGSAAVPALFAGCLIGAVASALGGLVIALRRGAAPADRVNAVLISMLARLAAVVALGAAAVLSGQLDRKALLLWITISYSALLVVDTWYAMRGLGDRTSGRTNGRRE
jgi:hypothetical protein